MPTITLSAHEVDVDDQGYFLHPEQWTEDMAADLAAGEGIAALTPEHWEVIRFMRRQYQERGQGPSVRALSKLSGVSIKDLYRLFPGGPAKEAAKIAGIPKPRGCI